MPNTARLGDRCTGHGCWPSRPNRTASDDVEINDIGAHRVNDFWEPHQCETIHDGVTISGSPDVEVNDQPLARVGDLVSCGSLIMTGSDDVLANE